ncbi:UNVERIFIED_CONTAM: hypothetical protein K2H54_010479 [Gekko kuhli]
MPPVQDRGITGKLEPVSPVSPTHPDSELDLLPSRLSKEELIQNMDRVDREITMVEQQISKLKKKQQTGYGLVTGENVRTAEELVSKNSLALSGSRGTERSINPKQTRPFLPLQHGGDVVFGSLVADQQLEEEAAKPLEPEKPISPPPIESKHRSLVQIIYDENRGGSVEA